MSSINDDEYRNEESLMTIACAKDLILSKTVEWMSTILDGDYVYSMVRGRSARFVKTVSSPMVAADIIVKTVMEDWRTRLRASLSVSCRGRARGHDVKNSSIDYWALMDFPVVNDSKDESEMMVPVRFVEDYDPATGRHVLSIDSASGDWWDPESEDANKRRLEAALSHASSFVDGLHD